MASDSPAATHLQVSELGCMRGGRVLFRKLSFEMHSGTVLALRGSNGSGKSTLLRTLAGLLPMRAGELHWIGKSVSPSSPTFQRQLAYLSHHAAMNDAMTGVENLQYLLTLAGIPWQPHQVHAVLDELDLMRAARLAFGKCSQGQRRRFGLARVQLSQKVLWLLDEPDNALDEQGLRWLSSALTRHAAAGGMAIVASHRGLNLADHPTLNMPSICLSSSGSQGAV